MNAIEAKRLTQHSIQKRKEDRKRIQEEYEVENAYEISIIIEHILKEIEESAKDCKSLCRVSSYQLMRITPKHCKILVESKTHGRYYRLPQELLISIVNKLTELNFMVELNRSTSSIKIKWCDE